MSLFKRGVIHVNHAVIASLCWFSSIVASVVVMTHPALASSAAPALVQAADPALEARVKQLSAELRCLVCQNQSVADSDAPVARDMRDQVRTQLAAGKSDAEVKRYMTERFGDFVLYRPPLKLTTLALWFGPFVVMIVGLWYGLRRIRMRGVATVKNTLSDADRARARELLQSGPPHRS